jgi:hypothetical protein
VTIWLQSGNWGLTGLKAMPRLHHGRQGRPWIAVKPPGMPRLLVTRMTMAAWSRKGPRVSLTKRASERHHEHGRLIEPVESLRISSTRRFDEGCILLDCSLARGCQTRARPTSQERELCCPPTTRRAMPERDRYCCQRALEHSWRARRPRRGPARRGERSLGTFLSIVKGRCR